MPKQDPLVEQSIQQLQVQALNFGYRFIHDSKVRAWYMQTTQEFSEQLRQAHANGSMTSRQAAEAAHQMRNEIMEMARVRSTELGRAKAKALKGKGIAFEKLLEKYSQQKFKQAFNSLGKHQQEAILLEIVDSAGRANPKVSASARRLGAAGRALWVLSIAVSVYNVATSNHKLDTAARETVGFGGGFAGGAAAGALAGIWFGPVGVAVGVAIGGVVGSLVADELYVELVPMATQRVASMVDKYTRPFSTDDEGLAKALYERGGVDTNFVKSVFAVLAERYSSDSDDVALAYVQLVRSRGGSQQLALKLDKEFKEFLIQLMDQGWTSGEESSAIKYLRAL
ncbi:hypothetical protein [Archangium violaceum]|uniref:Glycine zipper domain-containing protein n=1 Tax=Archangium violaceum Cb vi76 TaxID=1406225 RepID=A0A084SYA8_9BACT|nr:hypothetical protein [Archangium violaceum]KFA93443.1 hypothetical protein Q664_09145 [Archangium violaceum Cb vi76]